MQMQRGMSNGEKGELVKITNTPLAFIMYWTLF